MKIKRMNKIPSYMRIKNVNKIVKKKYNKAFGDLQQQKCNLSIFIFYSQSLYFNSVHMIDLALND
jgi:RNase P/RNase MRP subunit POP5